MIFKLIKNAYNLLDSTLDYYAVKANKMAQDAKKQQEIESKKNELKFKKELEEVLSKYEELCIDIKDPITGKIRKETTYECSLRIKKEHDEFMKKFMDIDLDDK